MYIRTVCVFFSIVFIYMHPHLICIFLVSLSLDFYFGGHEFTLFFLPFLLAGWLRFFNQSAATNR